MADRLGEFAQVSEIGPNVEWVSPEPFDGDVSDSHVLAAHRKHAPVITAGPYTGTSADTNATSFESTE